MDAKLFSSRTFQLSGKLLLVCLVIGLSTAALLFDFAAGRSFDQPGSLTLPIWICALASAGLGYWVVPILRALKAGQVIREDGPKSHLRKAGTPTMGAIFFLPVAIGVAILWSGFAPNVLAVSALTLAYAAIGWIDDWQIIRGNSNKGSRLE